MAGQSAYMSPDYAGDQLWIPNIVRSVGQAVVLTPLTSIAMVGIARQESGAASGVFIRVMSAMTPIATGLATCPPDETCQ
jgi:hypothetical protein